MHQVVPDSAQPDSIAFVKAPQMIFRVVIRMVLDLGKGEADSGRVLKDPGPPRLPSSQFRMDVADTYRDSSPVGIGRVIGRDETRIEVRKTRNQVFWRPFSSNRT